MTGFELGSRRFRAPDPRETFERMRQAALEQEQPRVPRTVFDILLEREDRQRDQQLLTSFSAAVKADPELAGEAQRLGIETGIDPMVAERNIDKVRQLARQRAFEESQIVERNPVLRQWLSKPAFARVAHDDLENLGFLEGITTGFNSGRLQEEQMILGERVRRGVATPGQLERLAFVRDRLLDMPSSLSFAGESARIVGGVSRTFTRALSAAFGTASAAAGVAAIAGQAGPQLLTPEEIITVPAAAVTGFGVGFFVTLAEGLHRLHLGESHKNMIDQGVDPNAAIWGSQGVALVNTALDLVGVGVLAVPVRAGIRRLVADRVAQGLSRRTVGQAAGQFAVGTAAGVAGETLTETTQELVSHLGELAAGGDPGPLGEKLAQVAEQTAKGMLLLALPGPAFNFAAQMRRVRQAETSQQFFQDLSKGSTDSQVTKRNPQAMEQFLQASAQDTAVENLYVEPQRFLESLEQAGTSRAELAKRLPDVDRSLTQALQVGGDVLIPTGQYGSLIAGTAMDEALQSHLRVEVDSMSGAEAQFFQASRQEGMADEASKLVAREIERNDAFAISADKVQDRILTQLKETGKFQRQDAVAGALLQRNFIATQAARLGITPEQFDRRFPLTIRAGKQSQRLAPEELQQPSQEEAAPEERAEPFMERVERLSEPERVTEFIERALGPRGFASIEEAQAAQAEAQAALDEAAAAVQPTPEAQVVQRGERFDVVDEAGTTLDTRDTQEEADAVIAQRRTEAAEAAEAVAVEEAARVLEFAQPGPTGPPRGGFNPKSLITTLYEKSDLSTYLHESAHYYLEVLSQMAADPNAPADVVADMNTFLEFAGVESLKKWQGQTLNQRRKAHETWAFSFELYLFEGKAPSKDLEGLFSRFRRWLLVSYRAIRSELNAIYQQEFGEDLPILTPEIRGVFDRLVASEDAIAQAEAVRSMAPLFQTQEESGLSNEEWDRYTRALDEAHELAVTDLGKASLRQMQWLSGARSRELKKLQAKHSKLRAEVRSDEAERVRRLPVYRAIELLRKGVFVIELGEVEPVPGIHRMNTEAVRALLPPDATLKDLSGMTTADGLMPDNVAQTFGFDSGQALIEELLTVTPQKQLVDEGTDQRMLQENGDLIDPATIEAEIEAALHNEARARFIAVETRFLTGSTQPLRLVRAAAKRAAREAIAKTPIGKIRPRDFSMAEGRAAREAAEASRAGDPVTARQKKLHQLLQNHLATESLKAVEQIEKRIDRRTGALRGNFKRTLRPDAKLGKTRNVDFVGAARAVLTAWGLAPDETPALVHLSQAKQYAPQRFADLSELVSRATVNAKPWREATFSEFEVMRDAVEALWFLSRRDKVVTLEGRRIEASVIVADIVGSLNAPVVEDRRMPLSEKERKGLIHGNWRAWVTRTESWAVMMDGGKLGAVHNWLFKHLRDPFDNYHLERNNLTRVMNERMRALDLGDGQRIAAPEINFGFHDKAQLIGALKHSGNESNLRKWILGEKLIPLQPDGTPIEFSTASWFAFIDRMVAEGVLTKEHFDYVQFVWDTYESLVPRLQEAHFEVNGFRFQEIEASPLTVTFPGDTEATTFRGGYVPATADSARVEVQSDPIRQTDPIIDTAEKFREQVKASAGFTFSRVEYNRPLRLSVTMDAHHLDEHLRYLHMAVPTRDILRLLRDRDVAATIARIDPHVIRDMFMPFLDATVHNKVLKRGGMFTAWESVLVHLRKVTGAGIMLGKLTTGLQQITGLGQSLIHVKLTYLRSSSVAYLGGGQTERATSLSTFMKLRMDKFGGQIRDDVDIITEPGWMSRTTEWTDRNAFFLQRWFQMPVDVITWNARYEQGLVEKLTEAQAIAAADSAVRLSQGSGTAADISTLERGGPMMRLFLQFSNFWFTQYNAIATRQGTEKLRAIAVTTAFAGVVAGAIVQVLKGGWEDSDDDGALWDDVVEWTFGEALSGTISATLPVIGPLALRGVTGEFGGRISLGGAGLSTLEQGFRGLRVPINALTEPDFDFRGKDVKDIAALLTIITGFPLIQLGRSVGYGLEVAGDEVDPTSTLDIIRGLLTGTASEASR